jgi:hypothetical protein
MNLLDMLIQKTVEIALEKEIIKSRTIIVDATHTKARFNQQSPKEIWMENSKLLRKAAYQIDENMKDKFPPKTTTNEDHVEYLQLSNDPDARVGHKTASSSFFGYKTHIAMNEERILTAAVITTGEKSDGKQLQSLMA